ncbi:MAG TPA: MaoC family dehydratase N-terminal domain-containing protein [bacterium]|nr:MaoC family dehydratase N-terminal domain-containing protein [bacterium]
MAIDRALIGTRSEPHTFEVERGAIRKFAEAIGDAHPAFRAGEVAPPTFPTTFSMAVPLLKTDPARVLHGEEEFVYERPLRAGDRVTCIRRIVDVYERRGRRLGPLACVVIETEGRDPQGTLLYRGRSTLLVR